MDTLIFILELTGMPAFAISGAALGMRKGMDAFGVVMLGLITSVGGGVMRDVVLGITPPRTFSNPVYAIIAIVVSIITFIVGRRHRLDLARHKGWAMSMLVTDSLGLGAFTVAGMTLALEVGQEGAFLLVFVGVVTGVGGGVLRDVLSGQTPMIFLKHVYASASIFGAILCVLLMPLTGDTWAIALGMASVVVIRLLSAYFRWNLPHAGKGSGAGSDKA